MVASVTNSRTTQPTNPQGLNKDSLKSWAVQVHNDLYPQVQSLSQNIPIIANLSNGSVSGGNVKQGRNWTVSYTIKPTISGNSSTSGASLTLPFVAANTSKIDVIFGTTILPAIVQQGSSTLVLPNWSTPLDVLIYGKADE